MPADASIFQNLLRPPKTVQEYDNEAQAAEGNKLGLLLQRGQYDAQQRGVADDATYRETVKGFGADVVANANMLRASGLGKQAMDYEKSALDAGKTSAEVANLKKTGIKLDGETVDQSIKRYRGTLDYIDTPQGAARWLQAQYADPVMSQHMQALGPLDEAVKRIPQTPAEFEDWRARAGMGMDAYAKKVQEDQKIAETARNNKAQNGIAAGQLGVAQGQLGVARQRLTLDQQAPKGQYDAERGVLVDPRTGEARPVTMDGQPLGAKDKPLNDSQSKALLFGSRMQSANKVLADLEKSGTSESVPGSRAPIIGGVISAAQGANQQSLDQAKRDFMTAVLRRESGAAISPTEFDTADKQYFPQIGDSKQVRAQKAANRQLAIDGVLVEVPEKQRNSLSKPPQQSGPKAGAIEDGHRFKGGDPSNPSNWEKVK